MIFPIKNTIYQSLPKIGILIFISWYTSYLTYQDFPNWKQNLPGKYHVWEFCFALNNYLPRLNQFKTTYNLGNQVYQDISIHFPIKIFHNLGIHWF